MTHADAKKESQLSGDVSPALDSGASRQEDSLEINNRGLDSSVNFTA